jgi:hypothetical protein
VSDNAAIIWALAIFFTSCSIVSVAHAWRDKPNRKNTDDTK